MILTREAARKFYDRFGYRQDRQAFYEDPALDDLVSHAGFATARTVVEFGCGTGRFAERLLADLLPPEARYLGIDISATMTRLATERLAPWERRALVVRGDGSPRPPVRAGAADRLVSAYVLDLLSEADIDAFLDEARHVLAPDGRLCIVGLTEGATPAGRALAWTWRKVHARRPAWVGGCRPVALASRLSATAWRIDHRAIVTAFAVPSEILVATPLD